MSDKTVRDLWEYAMIDLAIDFPIMSSLIVRLGVKFVELPENKHAAWTDGKAIYLNESFINECNEKGVYITEDGTKYNINIGKRELAFIVCHEVMHLIGLTFDRGTHVGIYKDSVTQADKAKWERWNRATDYEINSLLHNNVYTDFDGSQERKPIGNMPDWVLYNPDYRNLSAEQIYEKLLKEDKKNNAGGGSGKLLMDGSTGNNAKGCDFSIDEHMPILDDVTRNEVISKMSEVFGSRQNGTGSSAIDRMIDNVYKPQPFNWRRALTKYIKGWMRDNYTWNKPSRAGLANGIILPSPSKAPKMHIGVAIDTSGSIYDTELHAMMDHLYTILSQFKDFTIDVWCCGSVVYEETFTTFNASNKRMLNAFEFKSDGGNDMRKNFEFVKNKYKGDKLDVLIIMSDFYDPLDGDTETTSPCNVIYMCLDHDDFVKPSKIKGVVYPFKVEKNK